MTTDTRADYRPYSQIDLTDSQLKRLPMWARLAIASADARLNKGNGERAALLAALEDILEMGEALDFNTWPGDTGYEYRYAVDRAKETVAQARGDA